jgi:restriction system protein
MRRKMKKDFITLCVTLLWNFIRGAIKKGRGLELIISTCMMGASYYGLSFIVNLPSWVLSIPFFIYVMYWSFLFSCEKITSQRANPNWANREWWWALDGWEFEEEVAKVFRLNGYKAEVTKKTGDGGIDVVLYKNDLKYIVQCKHYQKPIPAAYLRELNGVMEDFKADRALMVASSGATKQGLDFIKNKSYFKLLDLEDMIRMGLRPNKDSIL